jgi:hypothetical protein
MALDPHPCTVVGRAAIVVALLATLAGCTSEASGPSPSVPATASAGPPASVPHRLDPTLSPQATPAAATLAPSATARVARSAAPVETRPPRTQSDPPLVKLRVGDWVSVITDSLKVRAAPGLSAARVGTLRPGEIALVTGERKSVDGYDWYGVSTLATPNGWLASGMTNERFVKSLGRESLLSWCGKVSKTNPVAVGSLVVPANAVDRVSLGVLNLVQAVDGRACLAVVRDGDGLAVRVDAGTAACGAPRWDGRDLRLAPTLAGNVVAEYRVRTTVVIPDALLTEGVAVGPEGRTNLQNVLILASRAPAPFGCVQSWVRQDETGQRQHHVMTDSVGCIVATERDTDSIRLRSSAGGSALWFGIADPATIDPLAIGQPTPMNVTAAYPAFFSLVSNTVPGCGG